MLDFDSTFFKSIIGGLFIGVATSLHLYLEGKLTGISSSIFNCISLNNLSYNLSLLTGMIFISSFMKCFFNRSLTTLTLDGPRFIETDSKFTGDLSLPGFIIAGFLIGFGAKMSNGCTSGHGICGIPRFSKRSIIATVLFIIFGCIFSTIKYYIPFLRPISYAFNSWDSKFIYYGVLILSILVILFLVYQSFKSGLKEKLRDTVVAFVIGCMFSYGLLQSGMLKRHVIIEFLTIGKIWNIQLLYVFASVIGFNIVAFRFIINKGTPRYKEKFDIPENNEIDNKLLLGAAIFGIGWGLSGICPGTSIVGFYLYCPQTLSFFIFMCLGMYVEYVFDGRLTEKANNSTLISKLNKFKSSNSKGPIENSYKLQTQITK